MSQYQNIGGLFPDRDICANRHGGNEQSVAANEKISEFKVSARNRVLIAIQSSVGQTCEEIEAETLLSHQSCSARISELKRDGLIRKIGTRPTRSGCQAAVYQAVLKRNPGNPQRRTEAQARKTAEPHRRIPWSSGFASHLGNDAD